MLFIDGHWTPGRGEEFVSHNPANGSPLWTGRAAGPADVQAAVSAARSAQPAWGRLPSDERAAFLTRFAALLRERQEPLAATITAETGKPLWDARTEVAAMIAKIDVSLRARRERRSDSNIDVPGGVGATRYRPHGVVAVFGPFNFPGHIANGQIVPALAAGNSVVFKPSELTPLVAEETVKLWEQAGLPPGVLNLVQGGRETGAAIVRADINALLFTGSLKTGVALQRALVERPDVLLALELGGNNPLIVHRVADITAAVAATIQSAYLSGGQRCTCARRLIVTPGNDEFMDRLVVAVGKLVVGKPDDDPQPFIGSLIHAGAVQNVLAEQQRLAGQGGTPLVESQPLPQLGSAFVSPGLIDVTGCEGVRDEEVFGPLLQLHRAASLAQAMELANQTRYGLVASILTDDRRDFERFAAEARAGLVNWNRPTTGASGLLPFGGVGLSGNHRPAGYFMIDSCNVPVASLESERVDIGTPLPGMDLT